MPTHPEYKLRKLAQIFAYVPMLFYTRAPKFSFGVWIAGNLVSKHTPGSMQSDSRNIYLRYLWILT
jgi:hypothetical protein